MPKSVREMVEALNDLLRKKGASVMTMRWAELYELGEVERFKQARLDGIEKVAKDDFGLVVGYGHSVVIVGHDRNFAPG